MIKNIQKITVNESTFSYIIQDFECDDIVKYIEESYFDDNYSLNKISSLNEESREVLNIISHIKNSIVTHKDSKSDLHYIKECNISLLYKYKYVAFESYLDNISDTYIKLERLLENQSDAMIEYTLQELYHCNELIEYLERYKSEKLIYDSAVNKFNLMVESLVFGEGDITIEEVIDLYQLTEALCEYESTLEASSRIITKGTEKVTKAIGNASAKSRGMSSSNSTIGQIKRGAKIVDDRASDAVNSKIDQILNFGREMNREKIIEGKATIRVSKVLKAAIALVIGGKIVKGHPLLGTIGVLIGLLGASALNKATAEREKKRILLELETELRITKEKIEDARGENAKEKKYQLMRIESELEKEIFRIKHGMKYY